MAEPVPKLREPGPGALALNWIAFDGGRDVFCRFSDDNPLAGVFKLSLFYFMIRKRPHYLKNSPLRLKMSQVVFICYHQP